MMAEPFNSSTMLAAVFAGAIALIDMNANHVYAASKKSNGSRSSGFYYGEDSPNVSYRSGPHTRIYITKRSWLDAGTEVLPGDRKFTDYAFPPGYSFGRENRNRPLDRQPLNSPSDVGGFMMGIPLY